MGRSPCCEKLGLKKGPWTPEEDQKLLAFIEEHGHGNWRALPGRAGLQRCGKSCRLRWTNYLRPDIKRGKFSLQEEQTIIQLHALLGNRWSAIATHLPKRTDNEIKNYWNTHLKKRLTKMGIDPVTHKPKNDALLPTVEGGQQSRNAAKLSHMAQWESARLEAEARLARQSKLRSKSSSSEGHQPPSPSSSDHLHNLVLPGLGLKTWPNIWLNDNIPTTTDHEHEENIGIVGLVGISGGGPHGIGSPTSTLSFSENRPPLVGTNSGSVIEFMGHENTNENNKSSLGSCDQLGGLIVKEEEDDYGDHIHDQSFVEGFTELLLSNLTTTTTTTTTVDATINTTSSLEENGLETNNSNDHTTSCGRGDYYEDNKNYWNNILNLVNSSPSHSPMF